MGAVQGAGTCWEDTVLRPSCQAQPCQDAHIALHAQPHLSDDCILPMSIHASQLLPEERGCRLLCSALQLLQSRVRPEPQARDDAHAAHRLVGRHRDGWRSRRVCARSVQDSNREVGALGAVDWSNSKATTRRMLLAHAAACVMATPCNVLRLSPDFHQLLTSSSSGTEKHC